MDVLHHVALVLVLGVLAAPAAAAPCAGFTDVEDTSPFCPSVEWIKNRSVTVGCTATAYCPADAVSRLGMAAFMKRLGTALTPVPISAEDTPGAVDIDANPVVCATSAFAVAGFPRRAYIDASVSASAPGDLDFGVAIVASTDGGTTWTTLNNDIRGAVLAGRWGNSSGISYTDIAVGQSVIFGMKLARADAGSAAVTDSRCSLRASLFSRDGTTSPF